MKKNERSVQLHVSQYEKMISDLQAALTTANEKVRQLEDARSKPEAADSVGGSVLPADSDQICDPPPCAKCSKESDGNDAAEIASPSPAFPLPELKHVREEWSAIFHERREIQHKISSLDHLEKNFEHKIALKHCKNDRVESIGSSTLR